MFKMFDEPLRLAPHTAPGLFRIGGITIARRHDRTLCSSFVAFHAGNESCGLALCFGKNIAGAFLFLTINVIDQGFKIIVVQDINLVEEFF